ncbi:MAG: formylglycine-generating enzyme family protein [Verrucomicrobiales bacterium]|nr:formylglycine-generating enzyme family protein [Verrucomicrobiales bacterium]
MSGEARGKEVLPKEVPITLPGGIPMVFRRIVDAGETAEFWRGSRGESSVESWYDSSVEEPRHRVRLRQPYYLGVNPVTQAQYRAMAAGCLAALQRLDGNKGEDPSGFKGDDRPVEQVDFQDAEVVAAWLTASGLLEAAGLPPSTLACLPTEAQWEYACRTGTETEYWNGDGAAALAEVGWFAGNSGNETQPVAWKPANEFGLHDMHGNVWEWCRDAWNEAAYRDCPDGVIDPCESDSKSTVRVLRGGSWGNTARICRSAIRSGYRAGNRYRGFGFRLCLLPGPVAASPDQERAESGDGGGPDLDLARERLPERPA